MRCSDRGATAARPDATSASSDALPASAGAPSGCRRGHCAAGVPLPNHERADAPTHRAPHDDDGARDLV